MSENKSKQHVQIHVKQCSTLKPNDLLVLANIKRHMNGTTKLCDPTIKTISKNSGFTERSVINSIKRLELVGELIIHRSANKANEYEFPDNSNFEMYSFEFLDNPALTRDEKAYLIGFQSCAVKNKTGYMGTTDSNEEIAKKINMSKRKIIELNKSLREKGIFAELTCFTKNEAGLEKKMKTVDMELIGQAILFVNDKVDNTIARVELLEQQLNEVLRLNKAYLKENKRLAKENELLKQSRDAIILDMPLNNQEGTGD